MNFADRTTFYVIFILGALCNSKIMIFPIIIMILINELILKTFQLIENSIEFIIKQ
jgi:hypothetical protein